MKLVIQFNYPMEYVSYESWVIPVEYKSKAKLIADFKLAIKAAEKEEDDIEFLGESFPIDLFIDDDDVLKINVLTLDEWFENNQINKLNNAELAPEEK